MADDDLTQRMQLSAAGLGQGDLPSEKKIQFSGEGAFGPTSSLRDRFHEPIVFSKPVDDQTCVSQAS